MSTDFDVTKVNKQYSQLDLNGLNGYEIQALGKLLTGLGESKAAKEMMEKHLFNISGTGGSPGSLN